MTQISGTIPLSMWSLTMLTRLSLSENQLIGTFLCLLCKFGLTPSIDCNEITCDCCVGTLDETNFLTLQSYCDLIQHPTIKSTQNPVPDKLTLNPSHYFNLNPTNNQTNIPSESREHHAWRDDLYELFPAKVLSWVVCGRSYFC